MSPGRFKPYPAYKDSGIEWLGRIPSHWAGKRLKRIATVALSNVDKKSVDGEEDVLLCNYTDVYYSDYITSALPFMSATASREQVRRFSLRRGDVLITKDSESWSDIAVPSTVKEDLPNVLCGYHLAHIRPASDIEGSFLGRSFAARGIRDQFHVAANGITRFGLVGEAIRSSWFPVPPSAEQRAIVAFLDRETARIDTLVAKKERLIELLQEERSALITQAVTEGLGPDAVMKDSGAEWLGNIPQHWAVRRLGQAIDVLMDFRGRTPLKLGLTWGGEIPALSAVNIRDGHLDLSRGVNYGSQELHDRWMSQGPTNRGDVLFTTEAPLGNVALVPDEIPYILSQRVVLLRPSPQSLDSSYLQAFLSCSAFRRGVEMRATGSTAEGIKRRYLMALEVCLPPIDEQRLIALYTEKQARRVNVLIARIRDAIDRLQEYRIALISAAVTGKIDVRAAAAAVREGGAA